MNTGMRQVMNALSLAFNLGFGLAVNAVVGVFLGRVVDGWLHSSPWGVAIGAGFGLVAGMRTVYYRVITTLNDKSDEEEKRPKDGNEKGN